MCIRDRASAHIPHLSVSHRPVFLLNSCLGQFSAAWLPRHPFSRSYGVILPSSLTIVRSLTLGFSPHLPVSVCGTGTLDLTSGFSWQREISCFCSFASPSQLDLRMPDLPNIQPHCLDTLNQRRAQLILLRPHFIQTNLGGTGISTCCPSPTAFALGLGPD